MQNEKIISCLNYVLERSKDSLRDYIHSNGDSTYMDNMKRYLSVANIYMNEIMGENNVA